MALQETAKFPITITDADLVSNPGLVAYEDGYADAREQGQSGYLIDSTYSPEQRLRYMAGFTKGLRIYRVRLNENNSQIKNVS